MRVILPPPLELACLVDILYSRSREKVVENLSYLLRCRRWVPLNPCPLRCLRHLDHVPQKADLPAHHPHVVQAHPQMPRLEVMAGSRVGYLGGFPRAVDLLLQMAQAASLSIHCTLHTWQVNSVLIELSALLANAGHDLLRWRRFPHLVSR